MLLHRDNLLGLLKAPIILRVKAKTCDMTICLSNLTLPSAPLGLSALVSLAFSGFLQGTKCFYHKVMV